MSHELEKVLLARFFRRVNRDRRGAYAKLSETDPGAALKKVVIRDLEPNSCLIKLDEISLPSRMFNSDRECAKLCDYLLLTEKDGRKLILFLEMKSGCPKIEDIRNQFKGAKCLINYWASIMQTFYPEMDNVSNYNPRFVYFCKDGQPNFSRVVRAEIHSSPEKALKVTNPEKPISIVDLI
jgi:hypothetical protein